MFVQSLTYKILEILGQLLETSAEREFSAAYCTFIMLSRRIDLLLPFTYF